MDKILMLLLDLWSKGYTINSQTIWESVLPYSREESDNDTYID